MANVANEAALIAARRGADAVSMVDFDAASDRVIGGLEKKNKVQAATTHLLCGSLRCVKESACLVDWGQWLALVSSAADAVCMARNERDINASLCYQTLHALRMHIPLCSTSQ